MLNLLDVYGGIVVPDSFVCTKNLLPLYNNYILNDTPFIFESINRTNSLNSQKNLCSFLIHILWVHPKIILLFN